MLCREDNSQYCAFYWLEQLDFQDAKAESAKPTFSPRNCWNYRTAPIPAPAMDLKATPRGDEICGLAVGAWAAVSAAETTEGPRSQDGYVPAGQMRT
jgi:hypothetical protein